MIKNSPSRDLVVTVTSGSFIKAALVVLLVYLLFVLRDIVLIVLTSVVIASAIEPITRWFGNHRIGRLPAVIITYLIVSSILVSIFYFFVPPLLDESMGLLSTLPQYLDKVTIWNPASQSGVNEGLIPLAQNLSQTLSIGDVISEFRVFLAGFSPSVVQAVSAIFGGAFGFMLIVVLSFYLAVLEDGVSAFLRVVTPVRQEKYVLDLWKRSQRKIGQWMQGQFLLGLIIGVLTYLGLVILQVPYAFILALFAAMMELIPIFGPIIAAVPAIALGFSGGGVTLALIVVGFYVIIQQFENHLIYPLVVRKVVGVPPLLVILSLLIGFQLAGFLGVILSVPIAAAVKEYIDDIQKDKRDEGEKLLKD
ncbi:hypothetical protein COB55_00505 [Candidatus Wolfebacteria bacterium]|nr:MAG: hypothetical protein COB55_00505 [Candidatus Wolfebacteria bacterium]